METNINNKIKIVFGIPSLVSGGIEKQLIKQLRRFDRERFDISLITLFTYTKSPTIYDEVPTDVNVHRMAIKGYLDISGIFKLFKKLKEINPDIVVTSMFSANTIFRFLSFFIKYKVISREHNRYVEKNWWQKFLDKALSGRSEKIVSVSKSVADFASKQSGVARNKFEVIHNGVEFDEIQNYINMNNKDSIREKIGYKKEDKLIINVARLKLQKNQELLIRAFDKFSKNHPEWKLIIVGDGTEVYNLEKLIKDLNIKDKVNLARYKENVYDYYFASDLFALTSLHEGFPNVSIEAMAFGLPVISTSVPGVDEFLNESNGFLVENSVESVSNTFSIASDLSNEKYIEMSKNALQTARFFDIKNTVRKYEEIFELIMLD